MLETLHYAIFDAFDREEEHLYEFEFRETPEDLDGKKFVHPFVLDDPMATHIRGAGDVTTAQIGSLDLEAGQIFYYLFDYGDRWWHQIKVLAFNEEEPKGRYPKVTDRVGDSPPQYVGWDEEDYED